MTMEIGNKEFTLKRGNYIPDTRYWFLSDAYDRPSRTKIEIWEEWKEWFRKNSECKYDYMSIGSRNCFKFTINGQITVNGIEYTFFITSTRNELYKR